MDYKRVNSQMVYGGKAQAMKFSIRLWVLWSFLIISVISIINISASQKLLIFVMLIGGLVAVNFISSTKKSILTLILILAVAAWLAISSIESGIIVASIEQSDPLFEQGVRQGEIITAVNSQPVSTPEEYYSLIGSIFTTNASKRFDLTTKTNDYTVLINKTPEITVKEISKTKIKTGLDISGGARALVQPTQQITEQELQDLIAVSRERLNVFGLADVQLRGVSDLEGNRFMLVEVAGATPSDLESLISKQGKFEARIGNTTVFVGGNEDITHVFRNDATQSAVYPAEQTTDGNYVSRFTFTITLSQEAAQRHADTTKNIATDPQSGGQYLTENLTLILDGEIVDELRISTGLRGQVASQISIQGSGFGTTPDQALTDARNSMNKLQTILISGSLPFELEIVKLDTISPALGSQFNYAVLLAGTIAILVVSVIVFIRYRKFKISLALLLISFSEIVIILGIAAIIRWNLDLPSIAGILATIGTGVDQQIVIIDESRLSRETSIKQRMKRAIFIVMSAYLTSLVSLLPLFKAGAGLFKGFAITTLIGITAGVFITRPAFAELIKKIEE